MVLLLGMFTAGVITGAGGCLLLLSWLALREVRR